VEITNILWSIQIEKYVLVKMNEFQLQTTAWKNHRNINIEWKKQTHYKVAAT
jgi:hypothetical protein